MVKPKKDKKQTKKEATKPQFNFKNWINSKYQIFLLPTALILLVLVIIAFGYQYMMANKFFPLTYVGDTNLSFLTKEQATRSLMAKFNTRSTQNLQFVYQETNFNYDLSTSSATIDYSVLNTAFDKGHQGSFQQKIADQIHSLIFTNPLKPTINLPENNQVETIAAAIYKAPVDAQLIYNEASSENASISAQIQTIPGENGLEFDTNEFKNKLTDFLITGKFDNNLPIKPLEPKITTQKVEQVKKALMESEQKPINLVFQDQKWQIDTKQLLTIVSLSATFDSLLDKDKTSIFLKSVAQEIDQPVQEGQFEFDPNSKRVSQFEASQEGRALDIDKTYALLSDAFAKGSIQTIELPVAVVVPKIQTSDVNNLGIKELIGSGISHFAGSIPNRIFNVGLTASKINGVLIPPGEVFSFNNTVGDISAATGFKQAYVIKEGRTVLDDGGGVCQDSTTLFRAVLNAGLPIVKRTAHAYRVGYYEQSSPPGIDATIYYPSVDFQFKNDTAAHILIQAYTSGTTLYVNLYGTSDGRSSSLTKPIVSNITPAPPELRQDDPTLPVGQVKQVDWAANGATVSFKRVVTRNGQAIIDETWRSNYKPWQAVYLVGTKQ